MKFTETFCRPNSVVTIIPVGLQTILQYNEHGVLQKVMFGFEGVDLTTHPQGSITVESEQLYKDAFEKVGRVVPTIISTKGGTTWVFGVLHSDAVPCDDGILPAALASSYIKKLASGDKFSFYAGYAHSLAANYQGPVVIRNFLSMSGFNVLPHVIVPVNLTTDTIAAAMNPSQFPFDHSYIDGFFIYEGVGCRYAGLGLKQITAKATPELDIDTDGYWKGTVESVDGADKIKFSYSAILRHSVKKGATLLLQKDGSTYNILATRIGTAAQLMVSDTPREVKCPVCGKICILGRDDTPFQCDDPNCLSHSYPDATKLLRFLDLEPLEYEDYRKAVDKHDIQCLTDVLELPQYRDIEIETTLACALGAVVPASVVPNFDILERFANKCNNSIDTVKYYLKSPRRIETDLDIVDPMVVRFIRWIDDPYNVTTVTTILDRVKIVEKHAKFEGTPIFRGNKIAVTGKFKRGDLHEIESILRSFQAEVVSSIELGEDLPDVIVTGSLRDGISGQMIQKARAHNIPIQDEDSFFAYYELDEDMAQNLL